jgi:hypothetical protein
VDPRTNGSPVSTTDRTTSGSDNIAGGTTGHDAAEAGGNPGVRAGDAGDTGVSSTVETDDIGELLAETLAYARDREYTGWDYFDGMSSRVRKRLPIENRWLNLAFQEGIKRAPINLRRLLLVEKRRNYKGTALFTLANLAAFDRLGEDRYHQEALALADWLIANRTRGYAGFCGGHQHATQDLHTRRPAKTPGIVSTGYAVRALLAAARFDPMYAEVAETALPFVFEDLNYRETATGARIDYHASANGEDPIVLNANALGARLLLDLHHHDPRTRLRERAERVLDYVVAEQTDAGGWMYTDPPDASHLSMDNHHNGFIVESLLRHRAVTGSDRYADALERGLSFYRNTLFEDTGAPNWDEGSQFPRDIHAAAQGIVTFSEAGDTEFARRILEWTCDNLYAGDGQFYYQKRRFYTKRFTLMRWCQAWMAFALATLVRVETSRSGGSPADA